MSYKLYFIVHNPLNTRFYLESKMVIDFIHLFLEKRNEIRVFVACHGF